DAVKKRLPDGVPKPGKFRLADAGPDAKDNGKESAKESAKEAAAEAQPDAVRAEAAKAAPESQAAAKPATGKKPKKGE
ncbi:MAG TPA: hypothetical protein VF778_05115, partial [Xanthobacteraceae bacterium]